MQIRDSGIIRQVERIGDHYRTNISNRFIRPVLLQLPLDRQTWDQIDVLTEKLEQFRYQGFDLHDLYQEILASARFVSVTRREVVPNLRNRLSGNTGPDKVLKDMAVNNFSSNLQVFADLVNELYIKLVEIDKTESKGRRPVYLSIPDLQDIGRMLVGG